jgi:putative RNA 2'-phosphotransferase
MCRHTRESTGKAEVINGPRMTKAISKHLSYWLRHAPEAANLVLDDAGWTQTDAVRAALTAHGHDAAQLERVVDENDKQRFELSPDGSLIRARQGHSVTVELDWPVTTPPEYLFHGTVTRFLDAILAEGLKPMARHHVHLSPDMKTAEIVGGRRGKPVILRIASGTMAKEGAEFRLTDNGVWLTDAVPPRFLSRA